MAEMRRIGNTNRYEIVSYNCSRNEDVVLGEIEVEEEKNGSVVGTAVYDGHVCNKEGIVARVGEYRPWRRISAFDQEAPDRQQKSVVKTP